MSARGSDLSKQVCVELLTRQLTCALIKPRQRAKDMDTGKVTTHADELTEAPVAQRRTSDM